MRSVLIIDDKKIRKEAFAQAEKIIKKLDRLEGNIESFHIEDQKLFTDWFALTFREMRREIESKQNQYRALCDFHNDIITMAKMFRISLPEAILKLRLEEDAYARGTDQDRVRIDLERLRRKEFLQQEIDFEFNLDQDEDEDDVYEDEFGLEDDEEPAESEEFAQQEFDLDEAEDLGRPQPAGDEKFKAALHLEALKFAYRKLVRRLHPDLQEGQQGLSHWQKKMWDRVQSAYRDQDRSALEKLLKLVQIRNRELNDITVSEIRESQHWLKDELQRMGREARGLKSLPAWGFSRRKSYAPLQRKLERQVRRELETIDATINELAEQHRFLELLGVTESQRRPRARTRRRSRARRSW